MLTWCKLHTDILADAKLMRAARRGAKHLALLPWLMAWARAHDEADCGRLVLDGEPVEAEDIAAQIPGGLVAHVRACLASAESIGVLVRDDTEPGVLRFAAWDARSGKHSSKPSDHPDAVRARVRKHRETKHGNAPPLSGNGDTVTPGNDGNALRNATDREIEKEGELEADERETLLVVGGSARPLTADRPERPADPPPPDDPTRAALALTRAANQAVTEVCGESPSPYLATSTQALELAEAVAANGVPLDFAVRAVFTACRAYCVKAKGRQGASPRPTALTYFVPAVRRAWEEHRATLDAAGHPAPAALPEVPGFQRAESSVATLLRIARGG